MIKYSHPYLLVMKFKRKKIYYSSQIKLYSSFIKMIIRNQPLFLCGISRNSFNPNLAVNLYFLILCVETEDRLARDVQRSRLSHDPYLSRLPLSLLRLSQLKWLVNFPANRARSRLIIQIWRIAVYSLSNFSLFQRLDFPKLIQFPITLRILLLKNNFLDIFGYE